MNAEDYTCSKRIKLATPTKGESTQSPVLKETNCSKNVRFGEGNCEDIGNVSKKPKYRVWKEENDAMVWHDELALMAEKYIFKCKPYETDPCALFSHFKKKDPYLFVAQNRYIQQNTHYPNILIENALRAWYLERDTMSTPTYTFNRILQTNIGKLKNENNFSHLASPVTYHIGCAIRRFESGYILICNYHPFLRNLDQETEFLSGIPGSLCPITQPMRNSKESFANICIGAGRNTASFVKLKFVIFCTCVISIIRYILS